MKRIFHRLRGIILLKCPNCYKGNLFITQTPYNFKKFDKMNKRCEHCSEDFCPELDFYYGAMMVSHALTFILMLLIFLVVFQFNGWNLIPFFVINTIIILSIMPMTFRYSRSVWLYLFVRHKRNLPNETHPE